MKQLAAIAFCFSVALSALAQDEEKVFSGPQKGEKLAGFKFRAVLGEQAGKKVDVVSAAKDKSVLIIFVHQRTRPAFGLATTLAEYAARRQKDGLHPAVVFLTDDITASENWMKSVPHYFPKGIEWGVSLEGLEGPGSYGLNRKVTVTAIVGKAGRVTANYALVQPSLQADGPKILKSIVDVLGGGKVPKLAELQEDRYVARMKMDEQLERHLRRLLQADASEEKVKEAAKNLETYVGSKPLLKNQIGAKLRNMVRSGEAKKHSDIAQGEIIRLARKYPPQRNPRMARKRGAKKRPNQKKGAAKKRPGQRPAANEPNMRPYLAPVINKQATPKQVDEAAARVEKFVAKNEAARKALGRISTTVVNSDRFLQYGTEHAREYLKKWAKKYGPQQRK